MRIESKRARLRTLKAATAHQSMLIRLATMEDIADVASLVGNHRARLFYERHGFRGCAGYELLDKPLHGG